MTLKKQEASEKFREVIPKIRDRAGQPINIGDIVAFAFTGYAVSLRLAVVDKIYLGKHRGDDCVRIRIRWYAYRPVSNSVELVSKVLIEDQLERLVVLSQDALLVSSTIEKQELLELSTKLKKARCTDPPEG